MTAALVWITEYYTGHAVQAPGAARSPQASTTGHGTNIIARAWACRCEATALAGDLRLSSPASWCPIGLAGLYGIACRRHLDVGAWPASIVALDAYGPITDNAGGIAEMAEPARQEVRDITDPHRTRWAIPPRR